MAELQQYAHPNSPLLQPGNTMSARAAATARTTAVEIEVDQDETGRVIATRVVRRSGVSGFDRDAIHAIEQAVRGAEVPAIHGIWRSRWSFEVITSRDPLISAMPGLPGEAPGFGITGELEFDEVTGETEMHLPGMAHVRRRVRVISSRVVER
jgi:TonB family protein